jgi:hypothetical protein
MDEPMRTLQSNVLELREATARMLGLAAAYVIDIVGSETSQAIEVDAE